MGKRSKNAGIHFVNNLISAEATLNGFGIAHNTSIIQIIIFNIGRKNLYIIKNGKNLSNMLKMLSNISLLKFKLNDGFNAPDGIKSCSLLNRSSKSSGNPAGKGFRFGRFNEKGTPKPGIEGPDGPKGISMLTSDGLQGITCFLYKL
jgi:hypothetical protein